MRLSKSIRDSAIELLPSIALLTFLASLLLLAAAFGACSAKGVEPSEAAPVCCGSGSWPIANWSATPRRDGQHIAEVFVDGLLLTSAAWIGSETATGSEAAIDYRDQTTGCFRQQSVESENPRLDPIVGVVLIDCGAGAAP